MKYEEYDEWRREVREENVRREVEHIRQVLAEAKREGRLGVVYGMKPEQLQRLMDTQTPDTLHGEDCAFLWACGIRADQDLVTQGAR